MATVNWHLLDWDTAHFGIQTIRLAEQLDIGQLGSILTDARASGARLAYLTLPCVDATSIQTAVDLGGQLVDTKVTFVAAIETVLDSTQYSDVTVTEIRGKLDEELRQLALLAGQHSRFCVDSRFPRRLFESMYSEWMQKSLSGEIADVVLAADVDGRHHAGAITIGRKGDRADIGLLAVAKRYQGRHVGTALVRSAADWSRRHAFETIQVVTQSHNMAACRLYERCGFTLEAAKPVLHFWF
jgi:dTDP-4-amino-4,6-dideoxy-D-galactose acyltransferase